MAGYSGTPLIKKLGLKNGHSVMIMNAPDHYPDLLGDLPQDIRTVKAGTDEQADFIHLFAESEARLHSLFPPCKRQLNKDGMLWVPWIKKSSRLETDISEQDVRSLGLDLGLVDVKICAVDTDWSGLKFMYRREDRG